MRILFSLATISVFFSGCAPSSTTDAGSPDVGVAGDAAIPCGTSTCGADQFCHGVTPGRPGGTTSYGCEAQVPSCLGVADCLNCNDAAQRACLQAVCFGQLGTISNGGRLIVCPGA